MTPNRLVMPAIALFLFAAGLGSVKASGQSQAQQPSAQNQNRAVDSDAWDTPPEDLQSVQLKGFRDGIVGARKDFDKHREPDVNGRQEYRNPHLPSEQKDAYRDGFTRGYERGTSHFIAGPDQPVSQPEQKVRFAAGPWQGTEIQRRGFQDGMARARQDLDNRHRHDANERDESSRLKLSADSRLAYLQAFGQGYEHFMAEQAGGPLDRH